MSDRENIERLLLGLSAADLANALELLAQKASICSLENGPEVLSEEMQDRLQG